MAGGDGTIESGDDQATEARVRRWLLALLCAYVLSALVCIAQAPIANPAEHRCAEVVRGMVESGDWLVPRYEGAVRLNKPPLAYWAGAVSSELLGQTSLLALRLPSLAAGVGLLLVTFAWGRRAGGARLGLAAAACLATMELALSYGRRGVAEMELALCANLALLLFDRLLERPRWTLRAGFAVALGLALLAKATAGLMIVGVPIAVTLTLRHRWRAALAPRNLVWVALAFVIGLAWYVAILGFVPDGWPMLKTELLLPFGVGEASDPTSAGHFNAPWFHLGSLLSGAAPALIVLLPWAVRRAWSSRVWRQLPRQRFVFIVFASLFVAFSLLPQKQKHYMLPVLPALAILLADGALARARLDPASFARTVRRLGYAAAFVVLLALGAAAVGETRLDAGWPSALRLLAVGVVLAALLAAAARRGRPVHVGGASVAATLVLMAVYGLVFEPRQRPPRLNAPAAASPVEPSSGPAR